MAAATRNAFDVMCAAAEKRSRDYEKTIKATLEHFETGDPLSAEASGERVKTAMARRRLQMRSGVADQEIAGAEAKKGPRDNFMPVSFLATGAGVARAVARVRNRAAGTLGTGFMCSPGLFITNFHVIGSPAEARSAIVEFDFVDGGQTGPTRYRLNPDACFVFDEVVERDYVIIALGARHSGQLPAEAFGWCPLSPAGNKHSIGEFANIIQHPDGREKEVVLQDNLIAARSDFALHYVADTEGGSSGSPVFNNEWQVIALHHWGSAFQEFNPRGFFRPSSVNEGIRTSQILVDVGNKRSGMGQGERRLIDEMLRLGAMVSPAEVMGGCHTPLPGEGPGSHSEAYGSADGITRKGSTWTVPIKINVAIPGACAPGDDHDVKPPQNGGGIDLPDGPEARLPLVGEGYRPDFLDEHIIELPKLKAAQKKLIAPLKEPDKFPAAKPGELQFTHFSVVVNKERKIPFFGACNVDGKTLFGISSSDRTLRDYRDRDDPIFAADPLEDAEGGHSWRPDHRIEKSHQTIETWYRGKNKLIPRDDTDDADTYIAEADFDRGHIVRRTEPIWGDDDAGKAANRQTFNHSNAAPQTPQFNQNDDRAPDEIEAGEETRSWYAMEVAILRAALNDDTKMNVFTGPIFEDDDPFYDGGKPAGGRRQVPLTFWKIAVWEEDGDLKSLAMKYSQAFSLLKAEAEAAAAAGREALDDADELFMLRDFLTTVSDIEKRAGLTFDADVRKADILKGEKVADLKKMTLADFQSMMASGD